MPDDTVMPDDKEDARGGSLGQQAERARTTPERLAAEAERQAKAQGEGQSEGVPTTGRHEAHSYSPTGGPAVQHWQEGHISRPGLDDRGDVFFAAVEMTRMPMIVTDRDCVKTRMPAIAAQYPSRQSLRAST